MTPKLNRYLALTCFAWIVCILAIKPLRAQESLQIRDSALVTGNLQIWGSAPTAMVCSIPGDWSHVDVKLTDEKQCWEIMVREHNRTMNNEKSHLIMDRALEIAARQFGKPWRPCAAKEKK